MPLIPLFLQAGIASSTGAVTRSRMMNFCNGYDYILPIIDGTISAADRAHLVGCYTAIEQPVSVPVVDTHDGYLYSDDDYRRYRRHIEKLAKIADDRDRKLYSKAVIEEIIDDIVEEIPIKVIEIKQVSNESRKINYDALSAEIERIKEWLNIILERQNAKLAAQEYEDEEALLMILGAI